MKRWIIRRKFQRVPRGPPTPIIRSVSTGTTEMPNAREPMVRMSMIRLRMFIAEAVAQAIPVGRQTKEGSSPNEKRKALLFEPKDQSEGTRV